MMEFRKLCLIEIPYALGCVQETWMSSCATGKPGRTVGAKACQTNPFLKDSLTAKELRTPSRALPVLESGAGKPSRYLQVGDFCFIMACFV